MASNHPSNYVGLEKKIDDAIALAQRELDSRQAILVRTDRNEVLAKCAEVLGEAQSKNDELKGESKYTIKIKKLEDLISELKKR